MTINLAVTDFLNSTLSAVAAVIPSEIKRSKMPCLIERHFVQSGMSVLVSLVGELPGRLMLVASPNIFQSIGQVMYGIVLDGDMLESFVGEIGNMVAGNAASELSKNGIDINISPPTVLVGETKLAGFQRGLQVPLDLVGTGEMNIVLILDDPS